MRLIILTGDYRDRCHAVEAGEITWKNGRVGEGSIEPRAMDLSRMGYMAVDNTAAVSPTSRDSTDLE